MGGYSNDAECQAAGLDPKVVDRLAKRIGRAARDAQKLDLVIFGGAGSGSLRFDDGKGGRLRVAEIDGTNWDGGDGGDGRSHDGLLRGES